METHGNDGMRNGGMAVWGMVERRYGNDGMRNGGITVWGMGSDLEVLVYEPGGLFSVVD